MAARASRPRLRPLLVAVVAGVVVLGCTAAPASSPAPGTPAESGSETRGPSRLRGALQGLAPLEASSAEDGDRLIAAAEDVVDDGPHAADPLQVQETDGPFVTDAQAAWTLALAGATSGEDRFSEAAARLVDAWVTTARRTKDACPDSGDCPTSLMVSRAAPALVFAVDALAAGGHYDAEQRDRFRRWLRTVIVPAASDRDNNWGDAGTYLLAVAGVELGDRSLQERAADRWRERLDLIEPDGRIPEEMRRDDASLMYSQDALDYKVATADVLARAGLDLWDHRGRRGGTLRAALDLVAAGLDDPGSWPGGSGDLRVPDPSGVWALARDRWSSTSYGDLADRAAPDDGVGHSAVIWTQVTHPPRPR